MKTTEDKIKEIENQLSELKKEITQEKEIIYVPEIIKFELFATKLGLAFNSDKQTIYYDYEDKIYNVSASNELDFVKCKLVKVDKKDRKIGNWYYINIFDNIDHSYKLDNYKLYLGGDNYVLINDDIDISTNNRIYNNWYEVRIIE